MSAMLPHRPGGEDVRVVLCDTLHEAGLWSRRLRGEREMAAQAVHSCLHSTAEGPHKGSTTIH